jgi:hypothetical protein
VSGHSDGGVVLTGGVRSCFEGGTKTKPMIILLTLWRRPTGSDTGGRLLPHPWYSLFANAWF